MPALELHVSNRGGGDGKDRKDRKRSEEERVARGNPARVFRTRFTGFRILFQYAEIRHTGEMIAVLGVASAFSLLATVLFFMLARFEKRAIRSRRRRFLAAPMFALRLLFAYALVLVVDVMNVWIIIAVAVGHAGGWLLYYVYIRDCLGDDSGHRGGVDGNDDDDGDGKQHRFDESSVSSQSSDHQRQFWDLA